MNDRIEEAYLLTIIDDIDQITMTSVIPSRIELAKTLQLVENTSFSVLSIEVLPPVEDFTVFIKILKDEAKPKGLNFGNLKED